MEGEITIKNTDSNLDLQKMVENEITFNREAIDGGIAIHCLVDGEESGFKAEMKLETILEAREKKVDIIEEVEKTLLEKATRHLVEKGKRK